MWPPPPPQQKLIEPDRAISMLLQTGCLQYLTRLAVDIVVASQVAGIVVGYRLISFEFAQFQFSVSYQLGDQLRMVDHFVVAPELGYSYLKELNPCGHAVRIFFTLYCLSISMFF